MRRTRLISVEEFLDIRITQLKESSLKANNDYDKQWYNLIIQELLWIKRLTQGDRLK